MQVGDLARDRVWVIVGGALALGVGGLVVPGSGTRGAGGGPHSLASLPLPARLAVSRGLGRDDRSFWVTGRDGVLRGRDPGQGLRFGFTSRGATVRAAGGWVRFGSVAFGRGSALRRSPAVRPAAERNHVAFGFEWFANGPVGLEQGFTVRARPAGVGSVGLSVGLSGDLRPRLDGQDLMFGGVLRYGGLGVTDARGRALPAWLGLERGRLILRFDDAGARYPVTVDPYIQTAKLTASDGAAGDNLGSSVAVSGSTVVVGAPYTTNGGAVYVFSEPAGGWADMTQAAKLTASDGGGHLGQSVAVSGSTVVAGAPYATVNGQTQEGAVYVFSEPAGGWADATETGKLTAADGGTGSDLGSSVAVTGSAVVAGAPNATVGPNLSQGAVYVFSEPAGGWTDATQTAKLTASNGLSGDQLGSSVAVSGATVVAGADHAPSHFLFGPGAAYVFSEPAGGWADATQTAELTASDVSALSNALFGYAVAASGSTVVVGAPIVVINGAGVGAVYVFSEPGGGWADMTQTAKLTASDGAATDFLGSSVGVSGSTVFAGAENATAVNGHPGPGAVYLFSEPAGGWADATETAKVTAADGAAGDQLGYSVAVSGTTLVAGAPMAGVGSNAGQGAAYVFVSPASTSTLAADASATFSGSAQNVSLSATVNSTAGAVNEGTVTFTVEQGSTAVGSATTSSTVSNGDANVSYVLPAGTAPGSYTIDAVYNPGPDFQASSDTTHTLTVVGVPKSVALPSITGTPRAGSVLTCSPGQWTGSPTAYTYQWERDGTPIVGATGSTYRVVSLDQGSTLTCTVTASNQAGAAPASTSGAFAIPVPFVRRCPGATGTLSGSRLGLIRLGMTRRQARHAYTHSSTRGFAYKDFFCLTPRGTRVGYASPKLLRALSSRERRRYRGRVVWASTSSPHYAVAGIRPGATLAAAEAALPHGTLLRIGLNYWYLAPAGGSTAVLKVRQGVVEEIGIAIARLTRTRHAKRILMTSFS